MGKASKSLMIRVLCLAQFFVGSGCFLNASIKDLSSAAQLVISDPSTSFSTVLEFPSTQDVMLTITNSGSSTAQDMTYSFSGGAFSNAGIGTCGTSLGAGASCTLVVRFTSLGAATFTGSVVVSYNSENQTQSVTKTFSAGGIASSTVVTLSSLYPNFGANWLDWLKNDGSTIYQATDTAACDGTETAITQCVHGGQMRKIALPSWSTCTSISATDSLGVFKWACFVNSSGVAVVYSYDFQSNKGLKDLFNS